MVDIDNSKILDDLKIMLGFDDLNDSQIKQLTLIIKNAKAAVLTYLPKITEVPEELNYIVVELSIIRFNRVGNEGMKIFQQEGEIITYDLSDDLAPFMDAINAYLNSLENSPKDAGKVRFI